MRRGTPRRVLRRGRVIGSVNYTVTPVAAPNGEIFPGTPQLAGVNGGASFAIVPNAAMAWSVATARPGNGWATPSIGSSTPSCSVAPAFDNTMFAVTIQHWPRHGHTDGLRAILSAAM